MRASIAQFAGAVDASSPFPHPLATAIGTSFLYGRTIV
jgi:hypothetical protein